MSRQIRVRKNFGEIADSDYLTIFRVQKGVIDRICAVIGKDLDPVYADNKNLSARQKIMLTLNLLG